MGNDTEVMNFWLFVHSRRITQETILQRIILYIGLIYSLAHLYAGKRYIDTSTRRCSQTHSISRIDTPIHQNVEVNLTRESNTGRLTPGVCNSSKRKGDPLSDRQCTFENYTKGTHKPRSA